MPLIGFVSNQGFENKILRGQKRQTIRRPRKIPVKFGDRLFLYTGLRSSKAKKIKEATCTKVVNFSMRYLEDEGLIMADEYGYQFKVPLRFAKDDGFKSVEEMEKFFRKRYPIDTEWVEFVLIKW